MFDHPGFGLSATGAVPTGFLLNGVPGNGTINNGVVSTVVTPTDWNNVVFPNLALAAGMHNCQSDASITTVDLEYKATRMIVKYNPGISSTRSRARWGWT